MSTKFTLDQQIMAPILTVAFCKAGPIFPLYDGSLRKKWKNEVWMNILCPQARAVLPEIALSLSTDAFIIALIRFMGREKL